MKHLYLFLCILACSVFFCGADRIDNRVSIAQPKYPVDQCRSIGQIVGYKCAEEYYECDYGDMWFARTILCNNCIGDCPPGRVYHHPEQETCVWPETIGCGCIMNGQLVGRKCETTFYICAETENSNGTDWTSYPVPCLGDLVFDPDTNTCVSASAIGCNAPRMG